MWKKGQLLVCVDDNWTNPFFSGIALRGGIYTFESESGYGDGYFFIVEDKTTSRGHRAEYHPRHFRPLLGDSAISELTSFEPVKETSDFPIKISEPA